MAEAAAAAAAVPGMKAGEEASGAAGLLKRSWSVEGGGEGKEMAVAGYGVAGARGGMEMPPPIPALGGAPALGGEKSPLDTDTAGGRTVRMSGRGAVAITCWAAARREVTPSMLSSLSRMPLTLSSSLPTTTPS